MIRPYEFPSTQSDKFQDGISSIGFIFFYSRMLALCHFQTKIDMDSSIGSNILGNGTEMDFKFAQKIGIGLKSSTKTTGERSSTQKIKRRTSCQWRGTKKKFQMLHKKLLILYITVDDPEKASNN
jgi:hypothetical protein